MGKNSNAEFNDYDAFVDKFKPKKTTDDCYTPPKVYNAVLGYVRERYGVPDDAPILRPFKPGGDFEREEYPEGCYVIDNPPFSIMTKIVRFYCSRGIKFFLFAPALTLFSGFSLSCCATYIAVATAVEYENGAKVSTSFITNMGNPDIVAESSPKLYRIVMDAVEQTRQDKIVSHPKYEYPDHVCTAAMVARYSKYGVDFNIKKGEAIKITRLDCMGDKSIYGSGFLLSDSLAAEKAAAEKAAAEKAAAEKWTLSKRERALVAQLKPLS